MTVHQHAVEVGAFAQYLRDLTARLDPGQGWFGVFTRRDPVGMRSCLDGVEIPPWDVVESLLADLAALRGAHFAAQVSVRAAALYSASASAHDRRPGGRQELVHRLELMIREQGRAAERLRTTGAAGGDPADPEALAWAHDDHQRASARCTELRKRLAAVTVPHPRAGADRDRAAERVPGFVVEPVPAPEAPEPLVRSRTRKAAPAPAPRRKKPRGARFAGLEVDDEEETTYAPSPVPALPTPSSEGGSAPRGARFGGGPAEAAEEAPAPALLPDPGAAEAVAAAVGQLVRLRAEGRSGEAHVVLCEVAAWPAPRLPVLAVALFRAGLAADWTTLLWEASSLSPAGFAAAAGALAAAGRDEDCGLLLRQGVARPAAEVAEAVLALDGAGREGEARALLGAFVRVRTPQEAAELAGGRGDRVLPHLLAAAREVSVEREWDLIHALRVAGVPGV
ncbi:hypothetical protein [Streptomyces microflavus]|uniref:hypothetical protein n=1 Tax=Streptomyces microflavus TaxID=1919 RepID=UPI0033FEEBB0